MEMITIDLDWPTKLEIVTAWNRVSRTLPQGSTPQGRVSSGMHGVHIRSHAVLPADVPVNETMRRQCGDDPTRIEGDIRNRLAHNQVFYDKKGNNQAGKWLGDLDELIAEYKRNCEQTPTQNQWLKLKR